MALSSRQVAVGLIHHSDQGVQYASSEYVIRLEACARIITPTWSPDGHKIVFALISASEYNKPESQLNSKLCVINEDGKGFAVVLDTPDFKSTADWVAKK